MRINGVQCDKCKKIEDSPFDPVRENYSSLASKVPKEWFTVYQGSHEEAGPVLHFCSPACLTVYMGATHLFQARD